ncbi:SDR family oxidoreductase [Aquimarina sp. U1-2]|uniref:SDR family oxidoreductase n=1 Tax=Aquimarina sp. U1-2 TaxID=2823141 RepID=UPI001AECB17B|nr:SDR family oxidoreductase [Aquimarina sp. U1-2]MBP2831463.1 SDR family oxidoreductase [Aquimarina sp. U1-2]
MTSLFSIKNKIIVISGATGVLGTAISTYLAQEEAVVIVLGRSKKKVEKLVDKIKTTGGQAFPAIADVTDEKQLTAVKTQLQKQFGKIDVLINAAGGNMPGAVIMPDQSIDDCDTEALQKVMELNYMGTFLPTKILLPLFLDNKTGSIINISSMAASRPLTRVMGYSSSKAAIDNLTQWLAVECAHKYGEGLRVNAIAPGFFLTEQNRNLLTHTDGNLTQRGQQIIEHTPMGRFGDPNELLGAIQWLCSDAAKFVTGTIIPIDGGFNAFSGV